MDIIEGSKEIRKEVEKLDEVPEDVVSKLEELEESSKKVIGSLKNATSESEDRKKKIKKLKGNLDEIKSQVDESQREKEKLESKVNEKNKTIANLEAKKKERALKDKKKLQQTLSELQKNDKEKFNKVSNYLSVELDDEEELEESIKSMSDDQVNKDMAELDKFSSLGLFDEGQKNSQEQFDGDFGNTEELIDKIRKADSAKEIEKLNKKLKQIK